MRAAFFIAVTVGFFYGWAWLIHITPVGHWSDAPTIFLGLFALVGLLTKLVMELIP